MNVTKLSKPLHLVQRNATLVRGTAVKLHTSCDLRSQQQNNQLLKVFQENAGKWWNGKEFSILRAMNELRVPFIVNGLNKTVEEKRILDIGCGGGILSEPLARLGANVLGIDPVFESINQAQLHSETDEELKQRLKYRNCNIEDLSSQEEHRNSYDALVASEVLEHIEDVESFLVHCNKLLKPSGSLFITTINQTPLSWFGVIFMGEQVLQQLPKGTHTYDMFINLKGLLVMLDRLGYDVSLTNGFMYEPITGRFFWTPTTLTHYAVQAVKRPINTNLNYQQKRYAKVKLNKQNRPKITLTREEMMSVVPIDVFDCRANELVKEFSIHIEKRLSTQASIAGLESLKIEIEGSDEPLELRHIATLSMKGNNLIVINLTTMPEAIKPTLQALNKLGNVNPQVEVNFIYVPVPRVTREHREKLGSLAKQEAQSSKTQLKSLFSEYSTKAKRGKQGISEDLVYNVIENLHFETNKKIDQINSLLQVRLEKLLSEKY